MMQGVLVEWLLKVTAVGFEPTPLRNGALSHHVPGQDGALHPIDEIVLLVQVPGQMHSEPLPELDRLCLQGVDIFSELPLVCVVVGVGPE